MTRGKISRLRKVATLGAVTLITLSSGCALPGGAYQTDPALGNFNRPITATPPPERGGQGLDSPAYDAGYRIGAGAPEAPGFSRDYNPNGIQSLPTLTTESLFTRSTGLEGDGKYARRSNNPQGARLPGMAIAEAGVRGPSLPPAWNTPPSSGSVTSRGNSPLVGITSGSSISPDMSIAEKPKYIPDYNIANIRTMEEAQSVLASCGVKWQRLEQVENGDWVFACSTQEPAGKTMFARYEARSSDKMEAIRNVIHQIKTGQ
ncbi:MAG: hypothetical protein N2112_08955 [Gemmataceae bacterium]|nr:hypothetical protein [Gemmataceae bacterium]